MRRRCITDTSCEHFPKPAQIALCCEIWIFPERALPTLTAQAVQALKHLETGAGYSGSCFF